MRWPTVRLLTVLLNNKGRDLQESILVVPQGIPKLMDLLSDSREIIRNDVSRNGSVHAKTKFISFREQFFEET